MNNQVINQMSQIIRQIQSDEQQNAQHLRQLSQQLHQLEDREHQASQQLNQVISMLNQFGTSNMGQNYGQQQYSGLGFGASAANRSISSQVSPSSITPNQNYYTPSFNNSNWENRGQN